MANPFVGQILVVGFNFAPKGWASCDGQLLPISQNTALFSLLGTMYGGDGRSNFALPNLSGSMAIGQGTSTTGRQYDVGEVGGSQTVTLLTSELPLHPHSFRADVDSGVTTNSPANAAVSSGVSLYTTATSPLVQMNPNMVGVTGGSEPHNNMMPFLGLYFVIAMQGVFPARP